MASLLQHLVNALQVLSGIIFNVNGTALASLLIFGSENVVIPALILILIILIPGRRKLS